MNERGDVIRSASARDGAITYSYLYPYHVLPLPGIDRAVSSTTDMDDGNKPATSEWVQIWRLSDLTLLKSFALRPGPRGDEHKFTGELRLLPDGKSVYLHTFNCGLYLLRDLDQTAAARDVRQIVPGRNCGVPVISGHYWLQPVPERTRWSRSTSRSRAPARSLRVSFGDDEGPHWAAIDPSGRRVVVNSAGSRPNRLYIVDVDPATGALSLDQRFRDAGQQQPRRDADGQELAARLLRPDQAARDGVLPIASLQILHEHDFVALLVVEQLVDAGAHGQQAKAARPDALFLPDAHVLDRLV